MAYNKQHFTNGQTLKAEQLNHIEEGVFANANALENKQPKGDYPTNAEVDEKISQAQLGGVMAVI